MCKKKIKIYVVMFLFIFIVNISMSVHASTIDDIWTTGANFIKMGESGGATFNGDNIESAVQDLYSLFWWAGLVIAVIVGAILGVKFMTEGAEGKAKIKEALIPFCIGCVVIFGSFAIWKIAMNLFNDLESEEITVTEGLTACTGGQHQFDDVHDYDCNICNQHCEHIKYMIPAGGSMEMQCSKCGCVSTQKCIPDSDPNWYLGHTWGVGTGYCTECGYKCSNHGSHKWIDKTTRAHVCEYCGISEEHNYSGNSCTKCSRTCVHKLYENNGYVNCYYCNFSSMSCKNGYNGRITKDHDYKNGYCTECFMPESDYTGCKHWQFEIITYYYSDGVCYECQGCNNVVYCSAHIYVERDGVQFCLKCFTKKN